MAVWAVPRSIDLRVMELLAARLCHDLIGPLSAIGNGVELLTDEEPDFAREAAALVGTSARQANARLQFYRFVYGFSGGGLTGPAPDRLAAEFFAETSIACNYRSEASALSPEQQQLACAILATAAEGLPRGGQVTVSAGAFGPEVQAIGEGPGLSPELRAALTLSVSSIELTSRTVGGYFAGLLAEALACRLIIIDEPTGFRVATAGP